VFRTSKIRTFEHFVELLNFIILAALKQINVPLSVERPACASRALIRICRIISRRAQQSRGYSHLSTTLPSRGQHNYSPSTPLSAYSHDLSSWQQPSPHASRKSCPLPSPNGISTPTSTPNSRFSSPALPNDAHYYQGYFPPTQQHLSFGSDRHQTNRIFSSCSSQYGRSQFSSRRRYQNEDKQPPASPIKAWSEDMGIYDEHSGLRSSGGQIGKIDQTNVNCFS
jgi:hypothetical protein